MTSLGPPWNMPQSIRTRARSVVRRKRDPVTVVAPPRKLICTWASLEADDRVEGYGGEQHRQICDRVAVEADRLLRGGLGRGPLLPQDPGAIQEERSEHRGHDAVDQAHPR